MLRGIEYPQRQQRAHLHVEDEIPEHWVGARGIDPSHSFGHKPDATPNVRGVVPALRARPRLWRHGGVSLSGHGWVLRSPQGLHCRPCVAKKGSVAGNSQEPVIGPVHVLLARVPDALQGKPGRPVLGGGVLFVFPGNSLIPFGAKFF